jgi:sugar/nucleoside kinase (ribokinase family)
MSLLVVGSVAYDSIETPNAKVDEALGGSATFFSAAASYFAPVSLVAVVGEDFRHDQVDFLRQRQVDLEGLTTERGKTFRWKGRYLENMNDRETLYTHLNVFESFNPVLPEKYRNCSYVFLANISPDLQYHVIDQVHQPKFVAMDTMNFWISGTPEALRRTLARVNALLINDSEVKQLSGEDNIFAGIRTIQSWGPQILIVKKGEHGALMANGGDYFYCPAYPVTTLFDPTGAGDTFAGGFMGYLAMTDSLSRENLRRAVVFGNALASFCVEDFSVGRLTALTRSDIDARVTALRQMTEFAPDTQWLHSR